MLRRVEPEWLDTLAPDDPDAVRSRHDLRRVNACMGHPAILAKLFRQAGASPVGRLVEIGAGDGAFMLSVVRRLVDRYRPREVLLLDRQSVRGTDTAGQLRRLGVRVSMIQADVFDWLARAGEEPVDVMVANLFLHHFPEPELKELLALTARRKCPFLACEPRRSRVGLGAARLLGWIGCNHVTRHDARVSVRAGFRAQELSALWPRESGWCLREEPAGLFSHCFVARRSPNSA